MCVGGFENTDPYHRLKTSNTTFSECNIESENNHYQKHAW